MCEFHSLDLSPMPILVETCFITGRDCEAVMKMISLCIFVCYDVTTSPNSIHL